MLGPIWSSAVQYSTEIHLSSFSVKVFQGKGSDDKRTGTYRTRSVDWFLASNPHDSLLSLPLHSSTFLPFPPLPSFALPVTAVMWQSYPVVRTWTEWEVSDGPDQGWLSRVLPNMRKKRKEKGGEEKKWVMADPTRGEASCVPLHGDGAKTTNSHIDCLTDWLTDWFTDSSTHWLTYWPTHWRTDYQTKWYNDGLIDWLTDLPHLTHTQLNKSLPYYFTQFIQTSSALLSTISLLLK